MNGFARWTLVLAVALLPGMAPPSADEGDGQRTLSGGNVVTDPSQDRDTCPGSGFSVCLPLDDGSYVCIPDQGCGSTCTTDADCGAGDACVHDSCCLGGSVCVPTATFCGTCNNPESCNAGFSGECVFAACGNGIVDPGEECDDGNDLDDDGCSATCIIEFCGDGIVHPGLGEECDDGNNVDGDGCQANCLLPVCGDGIVDAGEACDDGNNVDGDGCQANCLLPFCGDGVLDAGEGCDDGNDVDFDGCSADCRLEGACCSDGPGTESECFITDELDCTSNATLWLGDGSTCTADVDCVALVVTFDSVSVTATSSGVLIRWVTALEIDTIGFRVLRDVAGGRSKALQTVAELIPAIGHGLGGASYELLDDSRASAVATHYYLEDIDITGRVTRHGPFAVDRGARVDRPARHAPER